MRRSRGTAGTRVASYDGDIFGDYTQGPNGVLRLGFGLQALKAATPLLEITGMATLDGMVEIF